MYTKIKLTLSSDSRVLNVAHSHSYAEKKEMTFTVRKSGNKSFRDTTITQVPYLYTSCNYILQYCLIGGMGEGWGRVGKAKDLLLEHGLGLATETGLLPVVTTLTLYDRWLGAISGYRKSESKKNKSPSTQRLLPDHSTHLSHEGGLASLLLPRDGMGLVLDALLAEGALLLGKVDHPPGDTDEQRKWITCNLPCATSATVTDTSNKAKSARSNPSRMRETTTERTMAISVS